MLYVEGLHHVSAFPRPSGVVRLSFNAKVKFYKAMAVPALAYGSEIWRGGGGLRIETVEMKLLRSVAGYTRKDQK
jgi:hypothetical protein